MPPIESLTATACRGPGREGVREEEVPRDRARRGQRQRLGRGRREAARVDPVEGRLVDEVEALEDPHEDRALPAVVDAAPLVQGGRGVEEQDPVRLDGARVQQNGLRRALYKKIFSLNKNVR